MAARWGRPATRLVLPLLVALALIWLEQPLASLAAARPGILPVTMAALLGGLLVPPVRRWLITTLCFGIACLATRDAIVTFSVTPSPAGLLGTLQPYGWTLLATLAASSAVAEAIYPGAVWARRCYFGAAALYFCGHGLLSFLNGPTWESIVLLVTGTVALVGVFLAHRIVAAEGQGEPDDDDIQALAERSARRSAALAAKEWKDSGEELSQAR